MELGGIADEMRALAAANPDVMKLEQIGTSTLGKPILAIKMTEDARNVPDGSRHAILFSAVNHAREWIAAEMGRRLPGWFAANKDEPQIRELIRTRELWFLPIMNPDGYDYTFTCGIGLGDGGTAVPCDYRRVANQNDVRQTNRFWRKTLRDNDGDGLYGEPRLVASGPGDGVDPNRNYPAKRGIDEEGANNNTGDETYRGPYALSEPENLAVDRLQRRVPFKANINYHSSGQLLLTPVSYTTDYYPPDSTLFDAITGTDGDEAVFPYRSQHSSDLYESNGDTIDNAYMNYGIIGWTPEMDTCATMGEPAGCNGFASPDNESKVEAVFQKNLQFALNVTHSLPNLGRPKNFDNDPSQYQVKPTQNIQPNRFDVSYGASQVIEATIRKELGDADITVNVVGQNGSVTVPMLPAPAGERYNEVKGYYFERRQATFAGMIGSRAVQAGDVVNVVVKAGGLAAGVPLPGRGTPRHAAGRPAGQEAGARGRRRGLHGQVAERERGLRQRAALSRRARRGARGRGLRGRGVRHRRPAGERRLAEPGGASADQVPDLLRRAVALRRRQLLLGRRLRPAGGDRDQRRAADEHHGPDAGDQPGQGDGALGAQGHARVA